MANNFNFIDISAFEKLDYVFAYNKNDRPVHKADISDRMVVGNYNLVFDKLNNQFSNKPKIVLNNVRPSYMIKLPDKKNVSVNYDLEQGYDPEVKWNLWGAEKIDELLQYIIQSGKKPLSSDIVLDRHILAKLMATSYYPKPFVGSTFEFQWLFGAQKLGNAIYMCYYADPYVSDNLDAYSGHRFGSYMTSDVPNQTEAPELPLMASVTQLKMVQTLTLGNEFPGEGLRLFFSSDIDGLDFEETEIEPSSCVEIKTSKMRARRYKDDYVGENDFVDHLKWLAIWAKCYVSGIQKLVLGMKTGDTQIVERIVQRQVEDIPTFDRCLWKKQITLDYAYAFLKSVQTAMKDEQDSSAVYLFKYHNEVYDFRRVSKEDSNYRQYQVLPQWFIDGMNNKFYWP